MAFISVDYDEFDVSSYKQINFSYGTPEKTKKFASGNFVKDWFEMMKFIIQTQIQEPIMSSSSVDNFISDGAEVEEAYLHMVDDKPVLKYIDRTKKNWYNSPDLEGLRIFVPENTEPTWEELKKLIK